MTDPTSDGRTVDERPITEADFELHVPPHIRENYGQLVVEQHGGDWAELADRFDRDADAIERRPVDVRPARVLAAWARAQAAEGKNTPADETPKGRTAPAKSKTA